MSAAVAGGHASRPGLGALLASPGLLSILFWGASFVATRVALEGFTPAGLVAARFLLGGAVVALVAGLRRTKPWPRRADFGRSLLLGLVLAVHILMQAFALRFTSAIHSGWIVSFSAVGVTLGSVLFLGERLPRRNWLGVALAVLGVGLVIGSRTPDFAAATTGDLLVLASAFTWAGYTLLSKRPLASSGPWRVTPFVLAVAGSAALLVSLPSGVLDHGDGGLAHSPPPDSTAGVQVPALLAVGFLGLFASGVAFLCWAATIERFGALRAGLLVYLQPFVTLALSLWLLDESVGWSALLGGPIVLLGVALAARR